MKNLRFNLFSIIFLFSSCITKQYIPETTGLSDEIYKEQLKVWDNKKFLEVLEYNRNQIGWMDDIGKLKNDTVYIIEEHNYSDEIIPFQYNYYALFWNKKNLKHIRSYSKLRGGEIKVSNEEIFFPDYKLKIINDWNINEIKKNITPDSIVWLGGDTNTLITRIIKNGETKYIESIYCKGL